MAVGSKFCTDKGDGREFGRVKKIRAFQMRVTFVNMGIDTGDIDRDIRFGIGQISRAIDDLPAKLVKLSRHITDHHVLDRKTKTRMRGINGVGVRGKNH